jgi:SAM-dependent methyltransferase
MNRNVTNLIRFFMDEFIPPVIRDSRWFMTPFFRLAYRKWDVYDIMEVKTRVWDMSNEEYEHFYNSLRSISRNRLTDLNDACLTKILHAVTSMNSVLDVGCGNGHLLHSIKKHAPHIKLFGTDLFTTHSSKNFEYLKASTSQLPFQDKSVDTVTCSHVIEHLKDPQAAIAELIRVARHRLIIVVPYQRPYYYTLDEHLHFFMYEKQLTQLVNLSRFTCSKLNGDWIYVGEIPN